MLNFVRCGSVVCAVLFCIFPGGCKRSQPAPTGPAPQRLSEVTIKVGDVPITVEVARTEAERRLGLMHRDSLGEGRGMLFVFAVEDNLSFYMKNTRFDLDLGYVNASGVLFQIERMKAYDTQGVSSREPALYALEVAAGFFAKHGIKAGEKLTIPPEVGPGE
ncbi:MAG: DUF192 domain-containing protein [Planctomycetia bacterium]|nr:DUF192 domain-containing protein [Planctomycetia bacterium]